jgi:VWFA-related protein
MFRKSLLSALLTSVLGSAAAAQVLSFPANTSSRYQTAVELDAIQTGQMDFNLFTINSQSPQTTPLQTPSGSVSKLDLKAPGKARREYEKGYRLLLRKDSQGALEHLAKAVEIYPKFVSALDALGTVYLNLHQNEQAREQFMKAVGLDDHMPNAYLNLGCANLALKDYPAAEDALRKASELAPVDLEIAKALAYGEYLNKDYPGVLATVKQVHARKHESAAVVHYFAAAAMEGQNNLPGAQSEMETLLAEDPNSASVAEFRMILQAIKDEEARRAEAKLHPVEPVKFSFDVPAAPTADQAMQQAQEMLQNARERSQIAEAEADPDPVCNECGSRAPGIEVADATPAARASQPHFAGPTFRSAVDEVAIFFAATDHGKSVTDLTASDIAVSDDRRAPQSILDFRNETELPLRLGLVIDSSNSVRDRFSFEQKAASKFLEKVVTGKDDLAFVVGFNNSVLLAQDFTPDHMLTTHAIEDLAPSGGTALWDAVAFAANKLASRQEVQPVARILVVISDGSDNSSSTSLKEAIAAAQHNEVAVYTVSTRDEFEQEPGSEVGLHALRTLAELTGGAAFVPGSVKRLNESLSDLQQVVRSRYLVAYKPASFQRDGRYRPIEIKAAKEGHPLRVYARKGYYASAGAAAAAQP